MSTWCCTKIWLKVAFNDIYNKQRIFQRAVTDLNDTHREKLFWSNSVRGWLLGCFWPFPYVYTINWVLYIPLSRLTLPAPCISESCIEIKINLNFYFHTSLWYLKRFYEGLKGLHKIFWSTTKKCENKNLS